MLYIRLCFDRPGTTDLREQHRAAHRAYFQPNLGDGAMPRLVQAGPLCIDDTNDTNLGSFMILEANSLADVQRFHDGDPFTRVGLYDKVFLHRWDRHIA
ncbi:YciI family protein [Burkholderia cepacia]|uniref:YciI family protein n=1 Tax=Burkholderia cepacia TaxID=292 RepID=UPI001F3F6F1B|nr:YciI family protein [Burkholderia cepacia]MCE4124479.1 YciI family protein [Burkholderia cepacia]